MRQSCSFWNSRKKEVWPVSRPSQPWHFFQAKPWFPLENPGILSIPLGFLGAFLGTLFSQEAQAAVKFNELLVRSNIGLGSEKATAH
jgi:Na+(H+)/acetate symporter ActP